MLVIEHKLEGKLCLNIPGSLRPTFVTTNNVTFCNKGPMAKDSPESRLYLQSRNSTGLFAESCCLQVAGGSEVVLKALLSCAYLNVFDSHLLR